MQHSGMSENQLIYWRTGGLSKSEALSLTPEDQLTRYRSIKKDYFKHWETQPIEYEFKGCSNCKLVSPLKCEDCKIKESKMAHFKNWDWCNAIMAKLKKKDWTGADGV